MKVIKTWEMIEQVIKDKSKKFENNYGYTVGADETGTQLELIRDQGYDTEPYTIFLDDTMEWTEIIEPVSFITAYNDCLENGTQYINEKFKQRMYYNQNQVEIEEKMNDYEYGVVVLSCEWIKVR